MCMWYPRRKEGDTIHHYTRSEVEFKASKMLSDDLSLVPVALVVEERTDGTVLLPLTYGTEESAELDSLFTLK